MPNRLSMPGRSSRSRRARCSARAGQAVGLMGHRERLTSPLVRDTETGEFQPATWDHALSLVADQLGSAGRSRARLGRGVRRRQPDQREGLFARQVRSRSARHEPDRLQRHWCMSLAASASDQALARLDRGLPFPLADIEETDVLVLVGSDLVETMPPAAGHLDRLQRGGQVVVIDPRRTPTARNAPISSCSHCRARTWRWRSACCT